MRRNKSQKIASIKAVPLFGLCTDKELADIAALTDEMTVPAGSVLTKEGEPGLECFIVVSGRGRATLRDDVIGEITAGEVIGEMALLDVAPRSATVTAVDEMVLLVLDPRSFSDLLDRHPSVAKRMLASMARRLRSVENAPTYQH